MARRNIRAATSLVLIPVLVLQAACYRALGPPEPVHPEDNEQMATLRNADRVEVVLIDGTEYRLRYIVTGDYRLQGRNDETRQVISFPWDSIQSVQRYRPDNTMRDVAIGVGLVATIAFLVTVGRAIEELGRCGPFGCSE